MVPSPADTRTEALQTARDRLSLWKARLDEARSRCLELDGTKKAIATAFLQQMKDRCDQADNAVLRLEQLEWGWQSARSGVDERFMELDETWRSIQGTLRPAGAVRHDP